MADRKNPFTVIDSWESAATDDLPPQEAAELTEPAHLPDLGVVAPADPDSSPNAAA